MVRATAAGGSVPARSRRTASRAAGPGTGASASSRRSRSSGERNSPGRPVFLAERGAVPADDAQRVPVSAGASRRKSPPPARRRTADCFERGRIRRARGAGLAPPAHRSRTAELAVSRKPQVGVDARVERERGEARYVRSLSRRDTAVVAEHAPHVHQLAGMVCRHRTPPSSLARTRVPQPGVEQQPWEVDPGRQRQVQ
jgi:hypothetical protein